MSKKVLPPPDTGCYLHPECLTCPLPLCRHDRASRGIEMFRLYQTGSSVESLSRTFNISRRQVRNRLKEVSGMGL